MGTLLTAGAINTDLVVQVTRAPEAGETITGNDFAIYGGGKGANQTLAAVRSGAEVGILGAIGNDTFGRDRLADLERDGVDVGSVRRVDDAPSGVALITIETGGQNRIAYVPGATAHISAEQAREAVERLRPTTILATIEVPAEALSALIAAGREISATIIVNAAPEPAAFRDSVSLVDILIVNETEARELLGWTSDQSDWEAAAVRLAALGPSGVVITLGATGALVLADEGICLYSPPKVTVIDTTGAGDAFCGAFAARIAGGETVYQAAQVGVIAGSLATTVKGAQPSQPTRTAIEAMMREQER